MKAIAIVALALALEGGFLLSIAVLPASARSTAAGATASSVPLRAPARRS